LSQRAPRRGVINHAPRCNSTFTARKDVMVPNAKKRPRESSSSSTNEEGVESDEEETDHEDEDYDEEFQDEVEEVSSLAP